ncbi:predicted protein [Micromonas commoda]|uniref:Uncharacterized protein n=1 Tax=Micromonas commoda (strain RCC299 / NOUM17 / CCMP2709) TaxID=296587 RepID=C1EJI4_MICCC|nr:predicted protein [Micromonas commoda]ACO68189.1 predicted protein [Micromonas commoda]|eukprot:XP_002506931.1 predicted protein [Micromonas commoda]
MATNVGRIQEIKRSLDNDEMLYREHQASVRKVVECTFGILKKRFRMLRLPFLVRDGIDTEKIFKTRIILIYTRYSSRSVWTRSET